MAKELSTEWKIKTAARQIFIQKGFAATRTRDIAEAANINLALLNYYFRSKEKLFEIVMRECTIDFFASLQGILNNENISIGEKIDAIVDSYLNMLLQTPNLPIFILGSVQSDPDSFFDRTGVPSNFIVGSAFFREVQARLAEIGRSEIHPFQIVLNILSMSVFPFIMMPVITSTMQMDNEHFRQFIEERRRLIPEWVKLQLQL